MDMRTGRWGTGSARAESAAVGSGVLFAVLAAIGFLVLGMPDADASGDQIVQYYADHETATQWQALLFGVAAVCYVWFGGTLAAGLRRAENDPAGRIPAIVVALTAASAGIYMAGEASLLTLARTQGGDVLYYLANTAFALSGYAAGGLAVAIALGALRTGLLADWMGWVGLGVGALLGLNGVVQVFAELDSSFAHVLGSVAFFLFLVWVGVASFAWWWSMRAVPAARAHTA